MAFKIVVELKVVNEDGDVVDHRGVTALPGRSHHPLHTRQDFREFAHIENAHEIMNKLHSTVRSIKEL